MKRFILCVLLFQYTYSFPDSKSTSFDIPIQNVVLTTAVCLIPYALSQLHTWWNNYSLTRLDTIALLGEVQKRLFIAQEPFHHIVELVQKYPINSTNNYFALKNELHQSIIQFQNNNNYKYLTYVNALNICIRDLKQLQTFLQKRIDTFSHESNALYNSYSEVYSNISTIITTFTNIYNYLKNTDEFAQDSVNNFNNNEDYSPSYLQK